MSELPLYAADARDYARDVLNQFSVDGRIEGTRDELTAATALILIAYAPHAARLFPRGCTRELELLEELAAVAICETRSPCVLAATRNLLQSLYACVTTDVDDFDTPMSRERYIHTTSFCFILAAVSDIKTRVARERNQTTLPIFSYGAQKR